MKELNALQRSVINSILWSLEDTFEQDEILDDDYICNPDNFVLSLTESEYKLFKEMADKGI